MNNDYLKTVQNINNETIKQQKRNNFFNYLKENFLSIIAIIISLIALFK